MEFPVVLKKEHEEIPGSIKKEVEFPGVIKKDNVEFPWVLVFGIGISKGCHTICGISMGEALFFRKFARVK